MDSASTSSNMVSKTRNMFSKLLSNPWTIVYVIGSLAIFIGLGYYVYQKYVVPSTNPSYVENRELINEKKSKNANVFLFSADWCPHCKELKKENGVWEQIKSSQELKEVNNYNVQFLEINGDDEKSVNSFEGEYKVKIDGFPSIYLVKDDQIVEFDANPTVESLTKFIRTVV